MHREREPGTHRQEHGRNDEERHYDRAPHEAPQRDELATQRRQRELRAGGERDHAERHVADESQRVHFVVSHQAEPRAHDEPDEHVAGDARQPRATGQVAAQERGEQEKAERQRRTGLERAAGREAMKKGHHQAQREQARERACRTHPPQNIRSAALLTMRPSADIFR